MKSVEAFFSAARSALSEDCCAEYAPERWPNWLDSSLSSLREIEGSIRITTLLGESPSVDSKRCAYAPTESMRAESNSSKLRVIRSSAPLSVRSAIENSSASSVP